jgi:hypothetical protein
MIEEDKNLDFKNNPTITVNNEIGKPVNTGGVALSIQDFDLEQQWALIRDEYLSHYPEIKNIDTAFDKGNFSSIIDSIANRRQRTSKEIRDEIMEWSLTK